MRCYLAWISVFFLLSCAVSTSLFAGPSAPTELRVSDQGNLGATPSAQGEAQGVSARPFFSAQYLRSNGQVAAVKARVQVAFDSSFLAMIWDSGFVSVDPTPPFRWISWIQYGGPDLLPGVACYWRLATQDAAGLTSPFSLEPQFFSVAEETCAFDLRIQNSLQGEQSQGSPVVITSATPWVSAKRMGATSGDFVMQVQLARDAQFDNIVYDSGPLPVTLDEITGRTPAVPLTDAISRPELPYFWRTRLLQGDSGTWSVQSASFVYLPPDPSVPAPAGFNRTKYSFGAVGSPGADMVLFDLDGNGMLDAIVASQSADQAHLIYLSLNSPSPTQVKQFGAGSGEPAFVACGDLDGDGSPDIAAVVGAALTVYELSGGQYLPTQVVELPAGWAIKSVQASDLDLDGCCDVLVGGESESAVFVGSDVGLGQPVEVPVSGLLDQVLAFDMLDDPRPEVFVVSAGTLFVFSFKNGEFSDVAAWPIGDAQRMGVYRSTPTEDGELFTASPMVVTRWVVSNAFGLISEGSLPLFHTGDWHEIVCGDLNGDGVTDALLNGTNASLAVLGGSDNLIEHQVAGFAADCAHVRIALTDADLDGFTDIVALRHSGEGSVFLNRPQLQVSIYDSSAAQLLHGESWIEFDVLLSEAPTCLVDVQCETFELLDGGDGGGDGDGDAVSDATKLARGQLSLLPYVPTTVWLSFVPGQISAKFRVPLTRHVSGTSFTFGVRISGSYGAVSAIASAIGIIYGPGGSSSGPPAVAGMQRDWILNGSVDTVARQGGVTYMGGNFSAAEWDTQALATVDSAGNRSLSFPGLVGDVRGVAADAWGSMYVVGNFTLSGLPVTIFNAAKLLPSGQWDTTWRPNPNGPVNAVVVDGPTIYLGGKFTQLGASPSTVFKNIAQVNYNGSLPTASNKFGVSYFYVPPQTAHVAEVLCLAVAAYTTTTKYLIVGGSWINRAHCVNGTPAYYDVKNYAQFQIGGGISLHTPLVSGPVRAIAVSPVLYGQSPTIIFGGDFMLVECRKWVYPNLIDYGTNLNYTNLSGEMVWGKPAAGYSASIVNALAWQGSATTGRLWIGRDRLPGASGADPLAVYTFQQTQLLPAGFTSGLNGRVLSLSAGPNYMLAGGEFTTRTSGGNTFSAKRLAAFSTQTLGSPLGGFRGGMNDTVRALAPRYAGSSFLGHVVGGAFTKQLAERFNLAAMDANGALLPWGPSTNGRVHALLIYNSNVYFGGEFNTVTGMNVASRQRLAVCSSQTDTIDANGWIADCTGSGTVAVKCLALSGAKLIAGGSFSAVNGVNRNFVAALSTGGSGAAAVDSSWNPQLAASYSGVVGARALLVEAGIVYIGGAFSTVGGASRPGIAAVNAPGASNPGQLISAFDAMLGGTNPAVDAIAVSSSAVYFSGSFVSLHGLTRSGVGAVDKTSSQPTPFAPAPNGAVLALAVLPNGTSYLAGDFTLVGSSTRKGIAALDPLGGLLGWQANVTVASGEYVRCLLLDDSVIPGVIWLGGQFTGVPHPGQRHITSYSRAWYITTSQLPAANENQAYPRIAMSLTEPVPCSWSVQCSAAPWLSMDPITGELYGNCPIGAPAVIHLTVIATQSVSPFGVATRGLVLYVNPMPPPTLLSIGGPSTIVEGPGPVLSPAPQLTVTINQLFGQSVMIGVEYINGSALDGVDYASVVKTLELPSNSWSIPLDLTIFGDDLPGQSRSFTVRISSLTSNVAVNPLARDIVVTIQDDDPIVPRPAIGTSLDVLETATLPAQRLRVVTNQPWFCWTTDSDIAGATQTQWRVQVSGVASFSPLLWDSGLITGPEDRVQLGTSLPVNGAVYYVRVHVVTTAGGPSAWKVLEFGANAPPMPINGATLLPAGTVLTTTPQLTFQSPLEADRDLQHFVVEMHSGPNSRTLDTRTHYAAFEYLDGSAWRPFPASGLHLYLCTVRLNIPPAFALDASTWTWTVTVSDGYETAVNTAPDGQFLVDPRFTISGELVDVNGIPDVGRPLVLYELPSYTLRGSALTGPTGDYSFLVQAPVARGTTLAVFIDNPPAPPLPYTPAFAAHIVRFIGEDMNQGSGPNASVPLRHGVVRVDSRGQSPLTLSDMTTPAGVIDPDLPFVVGPQGMQLQPNMTSLEILGSLQVHGSMQVPGSPFALVLANPQLLRVSPGALLSLAEGGRVECFELQAEGNVVALSQAWLRTGAASTTSGDMCFNSGSTLEIGGPELRVLAGDFNLLNCTVLSAGSSLVVETGELDCRGVQFMNTILDVATNGDVNELRDTRFEGPGGVARLLWSRVAGQEFEAYSLQFMSGATSNIMAAAGADLIRLIGCGGDLGGEAFDIDPGEATGGDIVVWQPVELESISARAGDSQILLLWSFGAQASSGLQVEVKGGDIQGGPYSVLGTVSTGWFVDDALPNDVPRYYIVTLLAGSSAFPSAEIQVTPRAALRHGMSLSSLRENGSASGFVSGSNTHFKSSTTVGSATSGVSVPLSSIVVLSEELILFDVVTSAAPLGPCLIEVTTPDVWTEFGAPGYVETVTVPCEVEPPVLLFEPHVAFVQTGGGIEDGAKTSGAFDVIVEFQRMGGAPIDTASLQCVLDCDIRAGGVAIAAGENLAAYPHLLWGTTSSTGASWHVDQVAMTSDPQEELVPAQQVLVSVRISNTYGIASPWRHLTVHVEGNNADRAYAEDEFEQGAVNGSVMFAGTSILSCASIEFGSDSGITINQLNPVGGKMQAVYTSEPRAKIGRHVFQVKDQSGAIISTGTYTMQRDDSYLFINPGANPLSTVGATNVVLATGQFFWNEIDLQVPGRNFPLSWSRAYRSENWQTNNMALGYGWSGQYLQKLSVSVSDHVTWHAPDGQTIEFQKKGATGSATWDSPRGIAAQIVEIQRLGDQSLLKLAIRDQTGLTYCFSRGADATQVGAWCLRSIEDGYRNVHRLVYNQTDYASPRLLYVYGDVLSEMDIANAGSTISGECLKLEYFAHGDVKRVSRGIITLNPARKETAFQTLSSVEYDYNGTGFLTRVRQPIDHRHGSLYRHFAYDQGRLSGIYDPDQSITYESGQPAGCYQVSAASPAPAFKNNYTGGKVISQSRHNQRTMYISYNVQGDPDRVDVSGPQGFHIEYELDAFGQAVSVEQDGCVTEYDFNPESGATARIIYPEGNSVHYMYTPGPKLDSADYTILNPNQNPTILNVDTNAGVLVGMTLAFVTGQRTYYSVVGSASLIAPSLYQVGVIENLTAQGVQITGTVDIFDGNSTGLSRFKVLQERHCETANWTTSDLITANVIKEEFIYGRPIYLPSIVNGPLGEYSESATDYPPEADKPTAEKTHSCETRYDRYVLLLGYDPSTSNQVAISNVERDSYGRVIKKSRNAETVMDTQLVMEYAYHDEATAPAYRRGTLKSVTTRRRHSDGQNYTTVEDVATSELAFNATTGYFEYTQTPIENTGGGLSPYATQTFASTSGRAFCVSGPATGSATGPRGTTYYFYDKGGRVTRTVQRVMSTHSSSGTGGPANPELVADANLDAQFPRPATPTAWGWIHTQYVYNEFGELTDEYSDLNKTASGVEKAHTHYVYDSAGRVERVEDPCGRITKFTYNLRGLTRTQTEPTGAKTTYDYDDNGNLVSTTHPDSRVTTTTYDGFNRPTLITEPSGDGHLLRTWMYYPVVGAEERIMVTATGGTVQGPDRVTWSYYDALGRKYLQEALAVDSKGNQLSGAVDGYGHHPALQLVAGKTDKRSQTWWSLSGDGMERHQSYKLVGQDVITASTEFDNLGNPLMVKSASDQQRNFSYDGLLQVTGAVESSAGVIGKSKIEYDPAGNTVLTSDAYDKTTTFTVNNLGWHEKIEEQATLNPTDNRETYVYYDLAGRVVDRVTALAHHKYEYNACNQIVRETVESAAGPKQETTYKYHEANGRLVKVLRPGDCEWTYTYDILDRVDTVSQPDGWTLKYLYDQPGRKQLVKITPPSGGTVAPFAERLREFTLNEYGEIVTAVNYRTAAAQDSGRLSRMQFTYNSLGLVESQTLEVFDDSGQPISVTAPPSGYTSALMGFPTQYETGRTFTQGEISVDYDAMGRIVTQNWWDTHREVRTYAKGFDRLETLVHPGSQGATEVQVAKFSYHCGDLRERIFGKRETDLVGRRSPYPAPSFSTVMRTTPEMQCHSTGTFSYDKRGLIDEINHTHRATMPKRMATLQRRYNFAGDPVIDRKLHHGGLSRVMGYNEIGGLTTSLNGHLISLSSTGMPLQDMSNGTDYLSASYSALNHHQRRMFGYDYSENLASVEDFEGGQSVDSWTVTPSQGATTLANGLEQIQQQSLSGGKQFQPDKLGRVTVDAATGLTHMYSHEGQLLEQRQGSDTLRRNIYDCFGRMVLQYDHPATARERGTILVPNIGMGGGGMGADTASEVTFYTVTSQRVCSEVVHFTYGPGSVTGGITWKRLAEFIAYARDVEPDTGPVAPHYRFLHEDIQGNTVLTTQLNGDRTAEVDYSEYGAPLHAPIALDGRWIASMVPHNKPAASPLTWLTRVDINAPAGMLERRELFGMELRVVSRDPQQGKVFLSTTVLSHTGNELLVFDPNGEVRNLWNSTDCDKDLTAVFDFSEGYQRGYIEERTTGWWQGQVVTRIKCDNAPFDYFMLSIGQQVQVVLRTNTSHPYPTIPVTVLAVEDYDAAVGGYKTLVLATNLSPTYSDPGCEFIIETGRDPLERAAAQGGHWSAVPNAANGRTTYEIMDYGGLTLLNCVSPGHTGWILQPDVNQQIFLPIFDVNGHTISVAGEHPTLGGIGVRWRIYSPPGVENKGYMNGALSHWVSGRHTRCLFSGYRYESPCAGMPDIGYPAYTFITAPAAQIVGRLGGSGTFTLATSAGFTGLYYTLHRHYDPALGRWLSLDPAGSPNYNLFGYCGNSPTRFIDPDGLWRIEIGPIALDTDGYGKRAKETWVGAAIGGWDAVTFGMHLTDDDKVGLAMAYGVDPTSPYFLAGQIVGNLTVTAAFTIASGGLGATTHIGRAATAARVIGKTMQGIMAAIDAYKVGTAAVQLGQTGEWGEAQTEAAVTVGLHVLGIGIGRVFKPKCFVAGTQVLAQDEQGHSVSKNIEEIKVGDMVWSLDEHTGEPGFRQVVETYVRETDTLVHLSYRRAARSPGSATRGMKGGDAEDGDGPATLIGTSEHPFWSLTRNKWVNMGELEVGERLRLDDGEAEVTAVRLETLASPVRVYNFQVSDHHTYFAAPAEGQPFVWVHNANGYSALKGAVRNEAGGIDFANSNALYKTKPGQRNIVKIEYTGRRKADFKTANKLAGFGDTADAPRYFVWHHLDDYDPITNTGTMQLVRKRFHRIKHNGGVRQYEQAHGVEYK